MMRSLWQHDETVLAEIGKHVAGQQTEVTVRIPRLLAEAAAAAWRRGDEGVELDAETCEERIVRDRAASLALIGAAVENRGTTDGDWVVVKLDAWFVGDACKAADARNLITGSPPT